MSSPDIAIDIRGVSKAYTIAHGVEKHNTLAETILARLRKPFHRSSIETFWALKDVSFQVKRGEVVGIIGRNGAGKSTLLKILSRITEPTAGEIDLYGRVGSLLEVGTGFHSELTGRENVFLNGAIMGMRKDEVRRQFDSIVAFAGVGNFIDTPVKRYSSGMSVKLAFSVAAHLSCEILIVDEVLAVGDFEFQDRCLGKMGEVARAGRTVLLVSHNMQSISTLTKRCVWLQGGTPAADGPTANVISEYLRAGHSADANYAAEPSDLEPRITHVRVRTSEPNATHICGRPLSIEMDVTTPSAVRGATLSFQIHDSMERPIVHVCTSDSEQPMCRRSGRFRLTCYFPSLRLYMGRYTLTLYLSEGPGGARFPTVERVCPFEVTMFGLHREFPWEPGTCAYVDDTSWEVQEAPTAAGESRDEAALQRVGSEDTP